MKLKEYYTSKEFKEKGEHTKAFEDFTTYRNEKDFIKANRSKSNWIGPGVYLDK